MFSRPNGDIEKMLARLPKIPTASCIDRMQKATHIKERDYDLTEKEKFHNSIVEFTYFAKKTVPQMKEFKRCLENLRM